MSSAFDQTGSWDRVAAELRACKESQQKAYGDVDSATLGRYLAGEMTPAERATLEQTLEELPDLRLLADLVQDVLNDVGPVESAPASAPVPVILPLAVVKPRRRASALRRYAPLVAAACLLFACVATLPQVGVFSGAPSDVVDLSNGTARLPSLTLSPADERMVWLDAPPAAAPVKDGVQAVDKFVTQADAAPRSVAASAEQLNRALTTYYAQGEVGQAERTLRYNYAASKKKHGPDHETTRYAGRQLAGVYQFALNEPGVPPSPAPALMPASEAKCPQARARNTARMVREQIVCQPTPEVRARVVPVLTEALRGTNDKHERLVLIKALGELGPAARPAVDLLCDRLKKSDDAGERLAVLVALDQMGPAARDAVPTLALMAPPADKKLVVRSPKLTEPEEQYARVVLHRLTGREAQVGVFDAAGLFSLRHTIDATRSLRKLARESDVEVCIETFTDKRTSTSPRLGPTAVHVVITSGVAKVQVSPALQKQGIDAESLSKQLSDACDKAERDKALDVVLAAVKKTRKK
jgi:hypothetical protein